MKALFATDGRPAANNAGLLLERIASRERVDVSVLSVLQTEIFVPDPPGFLLGSLQDRRDLADRVVEAATDGLVGAGFSARGEVKEGHPGEEVVRRVEEDEFDLVLMGAGSHSWLGNKLLGSTSTHVLHGCMASVAIVHELRHPGDRARILFGTDGSGGAGDALSTLMELADPARCDVRVVSVVTPPAAPPVPTSYAAFPVRAWEEQEELVVKARTERSDDHVRKAIDRLGAGGFTATGFTLRGYPSEQLLKEAESGDFDVVVVGSRGLGPMKRTFLGSVSDHLARLARAAMIGRRAPT